MIIALDPAIICDFQSAFSLLVVAAMATPQADIVELVAVAMPTPLRPAVVTLVPRALQQPPRLRSCQHVVHEILACVKSSLHPALNSHLLPDITWLWCLGRAGFEWAFLPLASCLHLVSPRPSPSLAPGFSPAFTLISDPATGTPPYAGTCPASTDPVPARGSDTLDTITTVSVCHP